ncbi:MAG: SoxR reducing system RseC family protein [Wenzhouxiangella sp.]|jgi:sigma-E factor negative regulatory protein RseC|nr:SoxR reducing system RseC family protein [Wenzhouxiangella sp.]
MIWQLARVVSIDAERLTLSFSAPEECQRCARGEGCGAGVFARLFSRRSTRVTLPGSLAVSCGDWVRVGLEPRQLVLAAAVHYGLPLLGFLSGAVAGHLAMGDGPGQDAAALATGLVVFAAVARMLARSERPLLNPALERLSCTRGDTKSSVS